METPWGPLKKLNLQDKGVAQKILSADKHQLLEGLVAEYFFDQILDSLDESDSAIRSLDVETIIAIGDGEDPENVAVVWPRQFLDGLGRYLDALEKHFTVFLVKHIPQSGFVAVSWSNGEKTGPVLPIAEHMKTVSGRKKPEAVTIKRSVRDEERQQEAIHGFLFGAYNDQLPEKALLPRLLINFGIQPWFRAVWNVDRIFLVDNQLWSFEFKHKYPFGRSSLKFGLNEGELNNISLLADTGIKSVHLIMVRKRFCDVGGKPSKKYLTPAIPKPRQAF